MTASIFDNWTKGDINGPFQPSGTADWGDFYTGLTSTNAENLVNPKISGIGGKSFSFGDLTKLFVSDGKRPATPTMMPQAVGGSNPLSPGSVTADLGVVGPDGQKLAGTSAFDLGPLIARAAVIIAGFIFIAAGLAMFRPGVTVMASAENLGGGLAKNVAVG